MVEVAVEELTDVAGYVSDESTFYGSARTRKRFTKRLQACGLQTSGVQASTLPQHEDHKTVKRVKMETEPKVVHLSQGNITDFLKSRPQIAGLQQRHTAGLKTSFEPPTRKLNDQGTVDHVRGEGDPATRQTNESVIDFLRRLPVADLATSNHGPWLWIHSPRIKRAHAEHKAKTDIDSFAEGGVGLLESFRVQRSKIEASNPAKAPATITRYLGPYRDQLEDDLLQLAVETFTTCGKWMLFPSREDVPRVWRLVAEATAEGKLGPTSKVATVDPDEKGHLICVYTYDFTDLEDVRRVLGSLVDIGLCSSTAKPIYYKCDGYTYLDIKSDNRYRLRASLFSSRDVLNNEVKVMQEGPVARLKRRTAALGDAL